MSSKEIITLAAIAAVSLAIAFKALRAEDSAAESPAPDWGAAALADVSELERPPWMPATSERENGSTVSAAAAEDVAAEDGGWISRRPYGKGTHTNASRIEAILENQAKLENAVLPEHKLRYGYLVSLCSVATILDWHGRGFGEDVPADMWNDNGRMTFMALQTNYCPERGEFPVMDFYFDARHSPKEERVAFSAPEERLRELQDLADYAIALLMK